MVLAKCETRKLEYGFTWSHDELRFEPAKVLKIPQRSAYCAAILYCLDRGVKGGEHAAGVSAALAGEVFELGLATVFDGVRGALRDETVEAR